MPSPPAISPRSRIYPGSPSPRSAIENPRKGWPSQPSRWSSPAATASPTSPGSKPWRGPGWKPTRSWSRPGSLLTREKTSAPQRARPYKSRLRREPGHRALRVRRSHPRRESRDRRRSNPPHPPPLTTPGRKSPDARKHRRGLHHREREKFTKRARRQRKRASQIRQNQQVTQHPDNSS